MGRFIQHILPRGFRKIRYYGWLSPRKKRHALPAIREALGAQEPEPLPEETLAERILRLTDVDITRCPNCSKGTLTLLGRVPRRRPLKPP